MTYFNTKVDIYTIPLLESYLQIKGSHIILIKEINSSNILMNPNRK